MMTQEFVTTGRIESGTLRMRNRPQLEAAIKRWKDCEVVIHVEQLHATRSIDQNALYWAGYVIPLSEHTGYDPLWIHAYFKKRFLSGPHLIIQDRNSVVIDEVDIDALTTTTLNKIEFGEYLLQIAAWAMEQFELTLGSNREAVIA